MAVFYDLKPGVSADGLKAPALATLPVVYGVTLALLGRKPIITETVAHRSGASVHPDGLAYDLRANDVDARTRELYAKALRVALLPFGADVVGPYPLPNGHVHVEFDSQTFNRLLALGLVVALLVVVL